MAVSMLEFVFDTLPTRLTQGSPSKSKVKTIMLDGEACLSRIVAGCRGKGIES
ncbi:MAG: hypothetical protein WCI03_02245 [bacterium]